MKALLIVDIQNDFLPGGSLEVLSGDQIIQVINSLQSKYDLVIATQDWHPATHKSFASQHIERQVFDRINLNGIDQILWPDHCVQGTRGAQLADGLDQARIEAIFRKGIEPSIDSYSGFFDNDRLRNTGLHGYLRDRSVTEVHVCGLAADFCVHFTAMDALSLGYKTVVLSKATKTINREEYLAKKQAFIHAGGLFV
ncbi:bifunctional nicotinamidase/pyrazinamidase [Sphingobacterium faecale]|uniref:nicotinamidase n=1 Tax=Sphingobacterium faecale TaxID=2803775 RepID=A0ABS1R6C4_9SPHI|nr:bifunctional nicotinamidase/pyrazinamidase [Sphingobacterium faecale]MBL1410254.1 bifunctional nicotinamidase/pyrazinamidase [Sphingobacterium faecale]